MKICQKKIKNFEINFRNVREKKTPIISDHIFCSCKFSSKCEFSNSEIFFIKISEIFCKNFLLSFFLVFCRTILAVIVSRTFSYCFLSFPTVRCSSKVFHSGFVSNLSFSTFISTSLYPPFNVFPAKIKDMTQPGKQQQQELISAARFLSVVANY